MTVGSCEFESHSLHQNKNAEIAQLVEHNLAKVGVASSSLVFRSRKRSKALGLFFIFKHPITPGSWAMAYGHCASGYPFQPQPQDTETIGQ